MDFVVRLLVTTDAVYVVYFTSSVSSPRLLHQLVYAP